MSLHELNRSAKQWDRFCGFSVLQVFVVELKNVELRALDGTGNLCLAPQKTRHMCFLKAQSSRTEWIPPCEGID